MRKRRRQNKPKSPFTVVNTWKRRSGTRARKTRECRTKEEEKSEETRHESVNEKAKRKAREMRVARAKRKREPTR